MYFHDIQSKIEFSVDFGDAFVSIFKDLVPWCLHVVLRGGGGGCQPMREQILLCYVTCKLECGCLCIYPFWKFHDDIL